MQVHAERGAPGDDPDVAERRHQVGEERDPLVLVGARWAARRLGKQRLGEIAQVDGLLRRRHELLHQGMRADEREQRRRRRPPTVSASALPRQVVQGAEHGERPVARRFPRQVRHRGVHARQVGPRRAARREAERGDPVGGAGRPLVEVEPGLGDDAVGVEVVAEDGAREADHRRRVALVAEGRRRGDGGDRGRAGGPAPRR